MTDYVDRSEVIKIMRYRSGNEYLVQDVKNLPGITKKSRKEAKRFKRKYLLLKQKINVVKNILENLAESDFYDEYQRGVCTGFYKSLEVMNDMLGGELSWVHEAL